MSSSFHHPQLILLITFLTLFSLVSAVQQSLAGVIDWHKPLIGIPRRDLSPLAWSEGGKEKWVVGTRSNVVAVLDGVKGEIDWRIQFGEEDWIQSVSIQPEGILVVSGTTQPILRLLTSSTGHIKWETPLASIPSYSSPFTPKIVLERLKVGGDIVGIQDGLKVFRVGGEDGLIKWEWDASSVGLNGQLINIASSGSSIHLFTTINGFSGLQLGHFSIRNDGTSSSSITTLDNISSPDDLVITSNTTTDSIKASYLSSGKVKSVILLPDGSIGKPNSIKKDDKVSKSEKIPIALKGLGLGDRGYFLVVNQDDSADIVSTKAGNEVIWHFDNETRNQRSKAIWNGFVNEQGQAFVSRLFWAHGMGLANLHIYNIDHPDGYVYTGYTFAFDDLENGVIVDSAITITSSPPIVDSFSLLLTTSTGSIQAWKDQSNIWTREEALAEVKEVRMVELPERKIEDGKVILEDEGVIGRLIRHVGELKSLPSFITSFIARFASGTYTKSLSSTPLTPGSIYRDQFGFQKLAILATSTGKIFAIDSAHGNIVWTTLLGLSDVESHFDVREMWTVRDVDTLEDAVVAIVAVRKTAESTLTVAYHLDAFTGAIIEPPSSSPNPKDGKVLFDGEPLKTFPLPITHCKTSIRAVAVADPSGSIHLFPFCKKIESGFRNMSSNIFYNTFSDSSIEGHGITAQSIEGTFPGYNTYLTPLESGHVISSIARPSTGPIASYGRVLGDRSTLYKYLNPHLVAFSTRHKTEPLGSVYIIDSTTGRIVFRTTIEGVEGDIQVAMAENWVVYAYSQVGDVTEGKSGNRLVSMEMFEVGKSGSLETSSFSQVQEIEVISKTFIPPVGIKALSMTSSLQGITSKDLIIIDDRSRVLSLPRRLLDPRRPVGALSKMDKEEMLVPYEVILPFDPRRVISHEVELLGINKIYTSPALLESTSLILATGLDIFSTRANPSGTFDILSDAFNKVQLVLTIAGLAVGIMVARPAVQRKVLRGRWY